MKKITILFSLALGIFSMSKVNAQAGAYDFAASSGTFTPITGGTDVNSIEADDAVSPSIPIGFTFNFDGVDYTDLIACSNGFISFATGASSTTGNDLDNGAASRRPLLAPLWDDLDGRATGGVSEASYLVSGTAPNRVFTFEFLNWEWNYSSSDAVMSFQVKLYETSNVVEYVYRGEAGSVNSASASIGISGVSSFLSLDGTGTSPAASNSSESSSLTTKPADGQVYSFTPPACVGASGLNVTGLTDTVVTLGWTSPSAPNSNVEFGPTGFTPGSGHTITNAFNPLTIDTLSPNTSYDFYVQDSCGAGDVADWVGPFTFQTECSTLMAPYTESFDDTSIPDCWSMSGPENWLFGGTWPDYGADDITDHTGNSGNWAGVDGSSGSNFGVILETPSINVSALTTPALEFYYFSNNTNNIGDNNELEVKVWDGAAWNTMRTIAEDNAAWVKHTIIIAGLTITGPIKVQFVVNQTAGTAYYNDQFIDDVSILEAPTCPNPYGLVSSHSAADSVILNWNSGYQETMWNIEYGVIGFTPGTGTPVVASDTTDTIVGLDLGAVYQFYVQADCGGGDASDWVGPITVATPVTNDSTCDAIEITPNTDYSSQTYSNMGATLQANESAVLPSTQHNTVWFKTTIPASGHLLIATCGSDFNTIVGAYANDTIICDSMETYGQVAYNSSNFGVCGQSSRGSVEICGATPGAEILFYVGGSSATQSGLINLTVTDYSLEGYAGEGPATPVSACAGDTVDLLSNLTGQLLTTGDWEYPSNSSAIVYDSTVNTGAFSLIGNEVYYIVNNACDADTATVVINAATVTNTGTAISNFQACSNGDVFLFDGLSGTVDAGGSWNDDTGTGLLNGNRFVANGLPNGAYQFTYTVDNNICPAASTQMTVNLVDCTNITEGEATTFGVYPNPNDGTFFITNGKNDSNIAMEVIDVQGKVIYSSTYNMAAGSQQEVSLGNVESGVYLVRVITNNQVFNTNVIVK